MSLIFVNKLDELFGLRMGTGGQGVVEARERISAGVTSFNFPSKQQSKEPSTVCPNL